MITTIGDRIRLCRDARKLTREQMAVLLKMPMPTLKNYELGYRYPRADVVVAIGKCLGNDWALFVLGLAEQPRVVK